MAATLTLVMRETLPYIWWKHRIQALPQDHLVSLAVEGVRRAVHVLSFLAAHEWEVFLRKHFRHMAADQRTFGRYTLFACHTQLYRCHHPFECYLRVLAIGVYIALYFHARGKPQGIAIVPYILEKFIDVQMSDIKVEKDFWTLFNLHIVRQNYLDLHLVVDRYLRNGRSKQDILRAITTEEYLASLKINDQERSWIDAHDIDNYDLPDEIFSALGNMVYQPDSRKYTVRKMTMAQKRDLITHFIEELNAVSSKLFGFDRLLTLAERDLEFKEEKKNIVMSTTVAEEGHDRIIKACMVLLDDQ